MVVSQEELLRPLEAKETEKMEKEEEKKRKREERAEKKEKKSKKTKKQETNEDDESVFDCCEEDEGNAVLNEKSSDEELVTSIEEDRD